MAYYSLKPLFPLGGILCSPRVEKLGIDFIHLLRRHQAGDWGDLCDDGRKANQQALESHEAILSHYRVTSNTGADEAVSVMTESDRSMTILFLAGETMDEPVDE